MVPKRGLGVVGWGDRWSDVGSKSTVVARHRSLGCGLGNKCEQGNCLVKKDKVKGGLMKKKAGGAFSMFYQLLMKV